MRTQEDISLQWLLSRGYTPVEAAEALGVSPSHVRRVLKGAPDRGNALKARIRRLPRKKLTSLRRSR
ncbi:helix-turn-helix domain-containing protein [Akkermansia massiliensis]|uniref:helix-turn-helix domain-containing protein n=1 Tax=Akkermansia TaxID=239934 RepID=UPI0011AF7D48|nr:helix-turn-helix domain-containing protein [Akkermansia sp. GGCC_0220]MBS6779380.1 helix-turn-helix domain-containing protein [Akkermansia sp.]MBT8773639.1 helix-turn-helix domain-containing protein [Akkermansia muciniphila]QWP49894.1 helix-turn-helix domain-containing protein [Akkermansia massiliensis]MBT8774644.1 helix-turn-helix domain-containing protein [Akkermansia muciniphila]